MKTRLNKNEINQVNLIKFFLRASLSINIEMNIHHLLYYRLKIY